MVVTMESAVFMGKNYQNKCQSILNTTDLTLKQKFDVSTKLVSERGEISGLETVGWENHSWKYLSLIGDERILNLQRTKVYVFSDSVLCVGKILENLPIERCMGAKIRMDQTSQNYRNFDRIDGEPMEFEWNISQDSIRFSSVKKSKVYCTDWDKQQKFSQEEYYLSRCSTTLLVEQKTMQKNVWQMLDSCLCMQEDLEKDNGHPLVLVLRSSIKEDSPQGIWDKIAERMLLEFAESGCPIFRATTPLSRGQLKSKGQGKLSIHNAADQETIETLFRIIVSASQLSLYGAVADM